MKKIRILSFLLVAVMLSATMILSASALSGDVNGDESISSKDYMMLKRYVLGSFNLDDAQLAASDINEDGSVNSKDYMMLKRVVLGTYSLVPDPVIDAIEAAIDSKGELTTTFTVSYLGNEGVATVSFEKVKGIVSLCGHLDIKDVGAIVDITIPLSSVSDTYTLSGKATHTNFAFNISGKLVAKEYSMSNQTIDVKFTQTSGSDLSGTEDALMSLCKTAMDEFLAQANDLLVDNEVGVNISDLGFTKYYNELNPVWS